MTLNGIIALILRFFSRNSIALHADYVTVVEDRPLQNSVFHFWPKLAHPAARSLCNSWDICFRPTMYTANAVCHFMLCYVLLCYLSIARNETLCPIYCTFLYFHTKRFTHIHIPMWVKNLHHRGLYSTFWQCFFTVAILAKTFKYLQIFFSYSQQTTPPVFGGGSTLRAIFMQFVLINVWWN